jgi:glucosamine-phosphate N-acetyltransferase
MCEQKFIIRELTPDDALGDVLYQLNPNVFYSIEDSAWEQFLIYYKYNPNLTIVVMVSEPGELILGCATLLIEHKIIHDFGKVAHIEDVVIHPDYQGKGYGKILVQTLMEKAKKEPGCYKVILDCDESKVPFYEKCGMKKKSIGMAHYI